MTSSSKGNISTTAQSGRHGFIRCSGAQGALLHLRTRTCHKLMLWTIQIQRQGRGSRATQDDEEPRATGKPKQTNLQDKGRQRREPTGSQAVVAERATLLSPNCTSVDTGRGGQGGIVASTRSITRESSKQGPQCTTRPRHPAHAANRRAGSHQQHTRHGQARSWPPLHLARHLLASAFPHAVTLYQFSRDV